MKTDKMICKLLSVDLKALTTDNKEAIIRYTDFKNCKDAMIEYDYYEKIDEFYCYRSVQPVLKAIKITIPCDSCSMEVISE